MRMQKTDDIVLALRNISLSFGGIQALDDISLNVHAHEILAIIGPNGAGKSSLLNIINGVYRPQHGYIVFRGVKQSRLVPHHFAKRGVARTFQNIALFKGMSVLDNVMIGRITKMKAGLLEQALHIGRASREEIEHRRKAEEIIEFLEIQHIRKTPAGALSYGLQKRVELARALAAEPSLLLLDEPMSGMNVEEKQDMCRFILDINEQHATSIVLIEHDMSIVMDLADRVFVLDHGKKIGEGTPKEIRHDQRVITAYLGVAH